MADLWISAVRTLGQVDHEFEAILGYVVSLCLKKKKKKADICSHVPGPKTYTPKLLL